MGKIILHVITNLERAGAQISVANIVYGLRQQGIDARIAYSSRGGNRLRADAGLVSWLRQQAVPLYDVPAMQWDFSLTDITAFAQVLSLIRRLRADVVHTHCSKAGFLGRLAAHTAGTCAIVHSVRTWAFQAAAGPRRQLFIALERIAARISDRLVAVSPCCMDAGLASGIGSKSKYRVIRSGIDPNHFTSSANAFGDVYRNLGVPVGTQIVGSLMRISEAKAPLDWVAVARRVANSLPDVHFLVIGEGNLRSSMESAVGKLGLAARFHFVGEQVDVARWLNSVSVFLLTSHWEGMPRSVVEAALIGVPVVATDVGGTRDIVVDGSSGVLCQPRDLDRLANGVVALLRDPMRARQMAQRAYQMVTPDFMIDRVVAQHIDLYDELVGSVW